MKNDVSVSQRERTKESRRRDVEGDLKNMFTSCGSTSAAKASLLEGFPK